MATESDNSDSEVILNLPKTTDDSWETVSEATLSPAEHMRSSRRQRRDRIQVRTRDSSSDDQTIPKTGMHNAGHSRQSRGYNANKNNASDKCAEIPAPWPQERSSFRAHHLKPEPYTGEEAWESYFSHFEDCAELGAWGERSKVLYLASSFRGMARQFYMSLDDYERRSYPLLVDRMKQRFGGCLHESKYLNKLENRKRNPGESIISLCDDLRQLTKKAYSQLDTRAQEVIALNQLYKIIPVEMKCRCVDHNCTNIHDAARVLDKYEAIIGEGLPKQNRVRAVDTPGLESKLENLLDKVNARLEHLETVCLPKQANNNNHKWDKGVRRCYRCDSEKHLYRDCPSRKNTFNRQPRQSEDGSSSQGNGSRSTQ